MHIHPQEQQSATNANSEAYIVVIEYDVHIVGPAPTPKTAFTTRIQHGQQRGLQRSLHKQNALSLI
jgi:hypothetical protein